MCDVPDSDRLVSMADVTTDSLLPSDSLLRCDVCSHRFAAPLDLVRTWDGQPCLRFRCPGRFRVAAADAPSSYRRMYRSGEARHVVAAEHTGQLSRSERERVEQQFKFPTSPDSPNVLTCTPTLEMGIDIGDLSAVMLTSIPRGGAASYVQRVGRAGRRTGNALVATFAGSDPASLYFLENPLRMIAGEIRSPSCYLDSFEILGRQFLAYLLDAAAAGTIASPRLPGQIGELFGKRGKADNRLNVCVDTAEQRPQMVDDFLALFGSALSEDVRNAMRVFAAGDLRNQVEAARDRWESGHTSLVRRREAINRRLRDLEALPHRDPDQDEDLAQLRGERGVLSRKITRYLSESTLSELEKLGLLPTYTLTDDNVELEAMLWVPADDDTQHREPLSWTFTRPAHLAVREFAPGSAYYAQGHRFVVDALDAGTKSDPAWVSTRLCPECGFGEPHDPAVVRPQCPRCTSVRIADQGAVHQILQMRRVVCIDSEENARFFDEADERDRGRYAAITTVDVDPDQVVRAFALREVIFGVELARAATIRFINFGSTERKGEQARVGGTDLSASRFRTCVECGAVDGTRPKRSPDEPPRHLGWCRTRTKSTAPEFENLTIAHELRTDAVRMLVPVAVVEAADRLATFKAVVRLGLRVSYGGDPEHLQVVSSDMPPGIDASSTSMAGARRRFVVLYDTIPGGTGYLDRVAQPDQLRIMFEGARELIINCPCADEGLQACHRCLLGVSERPDIPLVTRAVALEQLNELLDKWDPMSVDTVGSLAINKLEESELERLFRQALVNWDRLEGRVQISEAPGGRNDGYDLRITRQDDDGIATTLHWRIREQVDRVSGGVTCRPDFLFTLLNGPRTEIAVFTDGEAFHASADVNRIADDATKRQALLDAGLFVWNLGWADVDAFARAHEGNVASRIPANSLLDSSQVDRAGRLLAQLGGDSVPIDYAQRNAMHQLLSFVERPEPQRWEALSTAVIGGLLAGNPRALALDQVPNVIDAAVRAHDITPQTIEARSLSRDQMSSSALCCAAGPVFGIVPGEGFGPTVQRWTVLNVMDDTVGVGQPEVTARWRQWLGWANLGQFLRSNDRQFRMVAVSGADTFDVSSLHIASGRTSAPLGETVGSKSHAASRALSPTAASPSPLGQPVAPHDRHLVDTTVLALLDALDTANASRAGGHGATDPVAPPVIGWEIADPEDNGWVVEAAWVTKQIALTVDELADRDAWLTINGWTVMFAQRTTVQALAEALQ